MATKDWAWPNQESKTQLGLSSQVYRWIAFETNLLGCPATWIDTGEGCASGKVIDRQGNSIAGATVTLSGRASDQTTTDSNGDYGFTDLIAGNYTISVSNPGDCSKSKSFNIGMDETVTVNITLLSQKMVSGVMSMINNLLLSDNTYYHDLDGDGYGDPNDAISAGSAPFGYVSDNTDCDDTDRNIHPGATEVCNDKDDDCDGQIDEDVKNTFYRDVDGDGYGDLNNTTEDCSPPSGYVSDNTDCDDSDGNIHPGAAEVCNGKDDNCDGQADEGGEKYLLSRC